MPIRLLGAAIPIAATVEEEIRAVGSGARVCVLPEGPQTIPYVREAVY